MFDKILIANRGEIAVRIVRTAREMNLATVAVYSEPDRDALHVRMADEAFLLGPAAPSQSYLNAERLIEIARRSGAQAVHPGYGFLAENAAFAQMVNDAGLTWIGPHPGAIEAMGDKLRARAAMERAGVPIVPGGTQAIDDVAAARRAAETLGLPLALKASGGGGGKGLKVAYALDEIGPAFETARREAETYFKNGTIYAERYLDNPKHVEVQVLADKFGNVLHVGERDCSLQRRHQKLWEESPALVGEALLDRMRAAAVRAAQAIGYDSAGTIECLVSGDEFYFLEMNTRIQVEHTVTEMVTGLDLVREQICVAAGEPLGFAQSDLAFRGFAIEGRVNAEDAARGFRPAPGTITAYREPGGPGVRVDSAAFAGWTISADYDSLIAKLVVWAPQRAQAIARMRRALDEFEIRGVPTTLPLLRALCDHPAVADGTYGTATLEAFAQTLAASDGALPAQPAPAPRAVESPALRVEVDGKLHTVRLIDLPPPPNGTGGAARVPPPRRGRVAKAAAAAAGNDVVSPMHGAVVELKTGEGAAVEEGQTIAVVEAMKMMNEIRAHRSGTVVKLHARAGDAVEAGAPIVTIE